MTTPTQAASLEPEHDVECASGPEEGSDAAQEERSDAAESENEDVAQDEACEEECENGVDPATDLDAVDEADSDMNVRMEEEEEQEAGEVDEHELVAGVPVEGTTFALFHRFKAYEVRHGDATRVRLSAALPGAREIIPVVVTRSEVVARAEVCGAARRTREAASKSEAVAEEAEAEAEAVAEAAEAAAAAVEALHSKLALENVLLARVKRNDGAPHAFHAYYTLVVRDSPASHWAYQKTWLKSLPRQVFVRLAEEAGGKGPMADALERLHTQKTTYRLNPEKLDFFRCTEQEMEMRKAPCILAIENRGGALHQQLGHAQRAVQAAHDDAHIQIARETHNVVDAERACENGGRWVTQASMEKQEEKFCELAPKPQARARRDAARDHFCFKFGKTSPFRWLKQSRKQLQSNSAGHSVIVRPDWKRIFRVQVVRRHLLSMMSSHPQTLNLRWKPCNTQ
ncbi:hypothetical protein AB1Y20_011478 [Prymnesium parvum]|uniref:Uncharacterized protein n=1 Tax=Prymnesium parvum TaxID=97485 RepID=A0AB34IHJ1_PRYPA